MNKIIIVDDHSLFREGIKLLIEIQQLGEVIAEAENGKVLIDLLAIHQPDMVIMDIEMPVMNGVDATREALRILPDLRILALTMLNEEENYVEMINAGAMGFVLKTSGKKEFENAIKSLINGENYWSNDILNKLILGVNVQKQIKKNIVEEELTKREREILELLCEGQSVNEIANSLYLSPKTIETHRSNLLKKTSSKNTINLVLYAIKNEIVCV